MRISHIRFLGLAGPLALLFFPFVHRRAVEPAHPALVFACDILISFSLAMGFCAPVFVYYAQIRKKLLGRVLRPAGNASEAEDLKEVETEMKSFYRAAVVGVVVGVIAGCVRFL